MDNNPLVSFVIPTYNSEKTIERCLKSISAQTYPNIEIIIVDDFSTDNTLHKILEQNLKNLTLIKQNTNTGPSKCRNIAILASKGKYLSILDSDDFIYPNKTKDQIEFLENNQEYSIVGSNVIIADSKKEKFSKRKKLHTDIIKSIYYYNPFCHSSIIFKKSDFLKTEMYDEKIFFGEDHRLIAQLLILGKGYNIQKYLVKKFEKYGETISSKISKFKHLYYLFSNRIYIFNTFKKNKYSFKFILSLLSVPLIFFIYIFKIDKEIIRKTINDK